MGQVLHGSARTTAAVRRAIQHSQESLRVLAKRHGINPKTVAKWKKRPSVQDERTGPKEPRSTVLSIEEKAIVVAFRRHTLLPLDDCLYALQAPIPHLTRSSLHRCLQRHGISRLPNTDSDKPRRAKFKRYPIGFFHIDIAEVRTEQGKLYLLVALDRTSKFAFVELHERVTRRVAANFLRALIAAVPYKVPTVLTDNGSHRAHRQRFPPCSPTTARPSPSRAAIPGRLTRSRRCSRASSSFAPTRFFRAHAFLSRPRVRTRLRPDRCGAPSDQAAASLDEWTGRAHEPHHQGSHGPAVLLCHARPAAHAPCRLCGRLQLRASAQDPEGAHALRVYL